VVPVCVPRSKYVHWPSVGFSSRASQLYIVLAKQWKHEFSRTKHLHLALGENVNELVLALGNLNDLLKQTSLNLVLNF